MTLGISAIIPYYNGSRFIGEALASVRSQTLAPTEIIIVDDCSRPEEARALDEAAGDAVVIHLPHNRGPSVARNTGIVRARCDWIAFLDCDDLWEPRTLELQAAVVAANAACRAVHCGLRTRLPSGEEFIATKGDLELEDFLVFPCPIFPSAALVQKQALYEAGLFDPTKRCCEDLDLFLRFVCTHGKIYAVAEPLVIRRVQEDGLSRNLAAFWREADRVYRDFMPIFADRVDRRTARDSLRAVHTDMAIRALYARDFKLMWRMLVPATRRDVPMTRVLGGAVAEVVRNRWRRVFKSGGA
jgi:glycosyltransferase involved in cell wall biosynthesis